MLSNFWTLIATGCLTAVCGHLTINDTGFSNGQQSYSTGGKAVCIAGIVQVPVRATNSKILLSAPDTNMRVTELYVEFTQANSTLAASSIGGPNPVAGSYGIYSKLCLPADPALANKVKTLQFLTHGGTLDHTYWDITPDYSYLDAAATAGYATLLYDRLGTGLSDHPDPVQIVQLPIQIEIAHVMVQKLRNGGIGGRSFANVVGVGHSLGSALTQSVAAKYPKDFDALILQGTSTFLAYAFTGIASEAPQIANTDPSGRFKNLTDGYHTLGPLPQALQFAFYRYPGYDPKSKSPSSPEYLLVILLTSHSIRHPVREQTNQRTWRNAHPGFCVRPCNCLHWPGRRCQRTERLFLLRRQLHLSDESGCCCYTGIFPGCQQRLAVVPRSECRAQCKCSLFLGAGFPADDSIPTIKWHVIQVRIRTRGNINYGLVYGL